MKGTVKWFNARKGYGFIEGEDKNDVFVHHTALPVGTELYENDTVEYKAESSDRGMKAVSVKKIETA